MKRSTYVILMAVIVIFITSVSIGAAGMDKLVSIPTADLIKNRGFIRAEVSSDSKKLVEASFLAQPRFEVGGRISLEDSNELGVLAKIALVEGSNDQPAVAAGMSDESLYLVGSHNFAYGLRGHLGYGNDDIEGFFVGISKTINPVSFQVDEEKGLPPINLSAEYINDQVNLGVKVDFKQTLTLELGLMDLKDVKGGLVFRF